MSSFSFKNVVFYIQVLVNLICVRNFGKFLEERVIVIIVNGETKSCKIPKYNRCEKKKLKKGYDCILKIVRLLKLKYEISII